MHITLSFHSLSLHRRCNCSIPSGPPSALQFTQERDVRSNGRQRTNNSKITPGFFSLVFHRKRHCQEKKKAAFFGQGDTSEESIAPLRWAYQLLQTDFLTQHLPRGFELWRSWGFFYVNHIFRGMTGKAPRGTQPRCRQNRTRTRLRGEKAGNADKHVWKRLNK